MNRMGNAFPSPEALVAAARMELDGLAQHLAAVQPGESVHGARRRIKQLRSLLRLLRPVLGEETFHAANGALRAAASALAGPRRAEALVAAARKLAPEPEGHWAVVAGTHRAAQAQAMDPASSLTAARGDVARAGKLLESVDVKDGKETVAGPFLMTYAKARRRLRRSMRSKAADELHGARKLVIHHLHHLKLVFPEDSARVRALDALRETLGDLNDLDELEQLSCGGAPAADARRMRKARRDLLRRSAKSADRLFRHKPRSFAKHLSSRMAKRKGHAAKPRSQPAPVALQTRE